MNKISSEQILKFYQSCTYRREYADNPVYAAGERAYRDLCRTIQFQDSGFDRNKTKIAVFGILDDRIRNLNATGQLEYDKWFEDTAAMINEEYKSISFYYGQAQKWINMTMKYLLCMGHEKISAYQQYLHAPVDSIVVKAASDIGVDTQGLDPWSRIDKSRYDKFQTELRTVLSEKNQSVIGWEFNVWSEYNMY